MTKYKNCENILKKMHVIRKWLHAFFHAFALRRGLKI